MASYWSVVLIISICMGFYLLNDQPSSGKLSTRIANKDLLSWLRAGKYLTYKSEYKIFYVLKSLGDDSNEGLDSLIGMPNGPSCTVNVFIHGFPTASYDFIKIWNLFVNRNDGEFFFHYVFARFA
jgi:hypothetical protein